MGLIDMATAAPTPPAVIDFPPFQLDPRAGLLRRDATTLSLRPKTYAVLLYLAQHPGELVTKQALLDAVWPSLAVTEEVVRVSISELRAALGDDRAVPRFIVTIPRRGYRFIARLGAPSIRREASMDRAVGGSLAAEGAVVGRVRERSSIAEWLRMARSGRRQVAFITGEAGIGKTTLVESALRELLDPPGGECRVALGRCIEHFGGGEPYLPVLDALAGLCRGAGGAVVQTTLAEHAPDWVLHALGRAGSAPREDAATVGGTHEHTLHKLAACVDLLSAETPLVLILEDAQWSDYATLDLLSVLAQRSEPARLLVLCTLRPADAIVQGHPVAGVKRELVRKGICHEILLDGLTGSEVSTYLAGRFEGATLPEELLQLFVDRTEGNPFFLVTLVDHLLEQGVLVQVEGRWELRDRDDALRTAIPEGLRAVIEPRIDRLTREESRLLETAAVLGLEFSAHAAARIADKEGELGDVEHVEHLCDALVRRQEILRSSGESTWPDGTTSARYAFRHALYQQVAYQRNSSSARRRLHQAIGEGLEAAYRGQTTSIASELAAHFDRSRDVERAIRYHREAAAHAGSRVAHREIQLHLRAALDLLRSRPESPERLLREMPILRDLGWTLVAIRSWGDPEVLAAFTRLREIAERLEVPAMRLRAMESLRSMRVARAEYSLALAVGEEALTLAKELGDVLATGASDVDLASALIHLGELERAHQHAERGRSLVHPSSIQGVAARVLLAGAGAHLGWVARSQAMRDEALACAAGAGSPYLSAFASMHAAWAALHLRDAMQTRRLAEEALRIASERGFSTPRIYASMLLGWCDVEEGRAEEGRAAVRSGFAELAASGERTSTTNWQAILARAHLACGDVTSANQVLDAAFAFAAETGERIVEHELHRLRGDCLLENAASRGQKERAAEHFEKAIAVAAERKAALFELRAATSLLRLRGKAARARVVRLLERFDGDDDCVDAELARASLGA